MADEWQEYVKDHRTVCKYGIKCYQKNPEHHANYKHPPNLKINHGNRNKQRFSPYRGKNTPSPKPHTSSNDEVALSDNSNPSTNTVLQSIKTEPVDSNKQRFSPYRRKNTPSPKPHTSNNDEVPLTDNSNPSTSTVLQSIKSEPVDNTEKSTEKSLINLTQDITLYDSNTRPSEVLRELFLVDMPTDFYKFFEYLNEDKAIEKTLASVNLELIGPYDLLLGKLTVVDDKELYLIHWRFFYDPPEFQTVMKKKGKSEFHIGYFRDDPNELPVFMGSNDSAKDYHIKPIAENIFATVYIYLQNEKKRSPFTSVACQKLAEKVKKYAEANNISLEEYNMKKRQAKIVTKTFHGAGIVVPYNKKTQLGYRHLVENDATIKKLFTKFEAAKTQSEKDSILSELQPVITYASIAVDECDFGTGLEAGIALFCSGLKELEPSALSSLTAAYSLLNREPFCKIIQAHLKYRRKGPNLSM